MRATLIACLLASTLYAQLFAQKQPFDVTAMLKIARISEPQLSPDGKSVAFTVQTVDVDQNIKPTRSGCCRRMAVRRCRSPTMAP